MKKYFEEQKAQDMRDKASFSEEFISNLVTELKGRKVPIYMDLLRELISGTAELPVLDRYLNRAVDEHVNRIYQALSPSKDTRRGFYNDFKQQLDFLRVAEEYTCKSREFLRSSYIWDYTGDKPTINKERLEETMKAYEHELTIDQQVEIDLLKGVAELADRGLRNVDSFLTFNSAKGVHEIDFGAYFNAYRGTKAPGLKGK